MHQIRAVWSHALPRKNSRRRTGSRTVLISTRPLSRCLPSVSPVEIRKVYVPVYDSDDVDRDSLFDPPSTRKRGFKRPRYPWSLVKEWCLVEYDREVAYEEIKTIMTQSLDEAGSKIFIKPNANSIAGWRPKQVSRSFLSIFLRY